MRSETRCNHNVPRPATLRLGPTLYLALLSVGSVACGQYHWPERPVNVPTRALLLHEDAFVGAPGTAAGEDCGASVLDLTLSECKDACGPIAVARDGELFASLLLPSPRERVPVPEWARPKYATAPRDGGRARVTMPLGGASHTVTLTSSCRLTVPSRPAGVDLYEGPGTLAVTAQDSCKSVALTTVCR